MKRSFQFTVLLILGACFLSSCVTSQRTYEGAALGGAVGAAAGALIDRDNSWRGAVIGGALGAALGGITTEMSARAAREAAMTGRPVAYQSTDGWQRVEAHPIDYNTHTKCHKVRERIWQDGELVKDYIREVCEGDKTMNTY